MKYLSLCTPNHLGLDITASRGLFRNVPGSKWRFLSNVLAHVSKTGEMHIKETSKMVANGNN